MELGMIGLGRMGANMTERLLRAGHRIAVYDIDSSAVQRAAALGAIGSPSIEALVRALKPPKAIWLMVPAGEVVETTLNELESFLQKGDIAVDGGNSNYKDTIRRAATLASKGIHFVDVGTSGGIWGLREGYCLMIGGSTEVVDRLQTIFQSLAPSADRGWAHVGPVGAGHFVKMVHNGIEYGLMQAYAEGFALLHKKTEFGLDLARIAELWRQGSVVRSWLLDLTAQALAVDPQLKGILPYVNDSGEARWAVAEAIDANVAAPIITLSLFQRIQSRDADGFANKLLAVMRNKFGGHDLRKE
jgi:6-phosphogluconate dehydrogenase